MNNLETYEYKILEDKILPIFTEKSPVQLPEQWREIIVKYSPYIILILVPISLLAIGLGTIVSLLGMLTARFFTALSIIVSIASLVCDLLAIPGLFARKRSGWVWLYYGFLLSVASSLITLSIVSAALTFLISGFFLFQVRSYYE